MPRICLLLYVYTKVHPGIPAALQDSHGLWVITVHTEV